MADSSLLSISTDCFVVVPLLAAARALISCRPRTADKGGSADVDFDSRPRRRVRKVLPVVQKKVTLLLATPRGPFTESVQSRVLSPRDSRATTYVKSRQPAVPN
eukprot:TRINITY_DN31825_c0_g1_i1.p1 TRINITY_DN31825_c0_g1~~TRINITY_DN31825_c0_g1_i1.p1  ORF type:complete len:116 (-),score=0.52 TRINITY_DN31825_c0_g1_i1:139-450(-)